MRRLLAALALATAAVLAGCGDDGVTTPDSGLPPVDALDGADLFEPELEALGLRLTDRGGLIDRSDGGYEQSPDGDHYALYVEPIDDASYTDDDYVENMVELARLTAPRVFESYPAVATYDICQEPRTGEDDDGDPDTEPGAVTQIELRRATAEAVDWDTIDLDGLIGLHRTGTYEDFVYFGPSLRDHPAVVPYLDVLA